MPAQRNGLVEEGAIELTVNGDGFKVNVQSNWTLDYVLREKLGLTGTKEFCGQGACGACAVIVEGRPILSCMTLAIDPNSAPPAMRSSPPTTPGRRPPM